MNKKNIIPITILSLCFCAGLAGAAKAEEGIITTSDDAPIEGTVNIDDIDNSDTEPTESISTDTVTSWNDDGTGPETDVELENDIDHNGTSDEPLVVCASADEPGCEDAALEPEVDPEMWPLYISLGALGATILLVIIINLIGRQKKDRK